jgi:orotate phosphoribosyltransferase
LEYAKIPSGFVIPPIEEILRDINELQALKGDGHYQLSTGRHSRRFLRSWVLVQKVTLIERISNLLAQSFWHDEINAVLSSSVMPCPIIAYGVARAFCTSGKSVRLVLPINEHNRLKIGSSDEILPGERVMIIHDIAVRGGVINQLEDLITGSRAHIAGVGMVFDVSGGEVQFPKDVKTVAIIKEGFGKEDSVNCTMCREGIPLENPYDELHPS